jgi:hypothetical protein
MPKSDTFDDEDNDVKECKRNRKKELEEKDGQCEEEPFIQRNL